MSELRFCVATGGTSHQEHKFENVRHCGDRILVKTGIEREHIGFRERGNIHWQWHIRAC